MSSVEKEARYESASVLLTDASVTVALQAPAGHWYTLTGVNICASTGSAADADLIRFDTALTRTVYLRWKSVVPAAGSLDIELRPIVLKPGDALKVRGAANQHVDVSYMIRTRNPGEILPGPTGGGG